VLSAREGGPAWKSGIRGTSRDEYGRLVLGDIITAINGKNVRNSSDLYRMLDKALVGAVGHTACACRRSAFCRSSGIVSTSLSQCCRAAGRRAC